MRIFGKLQAAVKVLKQNITALYYAYKSNSIPVIAKIIAGITIGYLLSPIDLIPDFIPVLGMLDDLVLVPLLIRLAIRTIPRQVWQECKSKAQSAPITLSKKNWLFGSVIVSMWLIALYLVFHYFQA